MSCEELDELLAAYALDAVDAGERAAIEAHLAGCRRHDVALAELHSTAGSLPLAAGEGNPPPRLRARLLDAFDAGLAVQRPPVSLEVRARGRWPLVLRPAFAYTAAALLLLAVAGLVAWNIALQAGGDEQAREYALAGTTGSGEVLYLPDREVAVIELDLPEPPEGRAYQAWVLHGDRPSSLGLVAPRGHTAIEADLSDADAVAISEEPGGGSAQPTTEPLLQANLR